MLNSLVGQSQQNIRAAMKVTNAVGQGRTLYLATCNSTATLPTELRRRFRTYGEWFFDLPQGDEVKPIVDIYLRRYGLTVTKENPLPDLTEWTGAEVQSLCYLAYNLDLPFVQAQDFVVPMRTSAAEQVLRLRQQAAGRFLSVSQRGFYQTPDQQKERDVKAGARQQRRITLEDAAGLIALRKES
jgi:hypothetical protein